MNPQDFFNSRRLELDFIRFIINPENKWKRGKKVWNPIKDRGVKDGILKIFPDTNIRDWKKEYVTYSKEGSWVEIHCFVNVRNESQEFDKKIKRWGIAKEQLELVASSFDK